MKHAWNMDSAVTRRAFIRSGAAVFSLVASATLAGCGGADADNVGGAARLVVGSQDFYENEIVAEVFAQALEANGFEVERSLRIGQREVYMPEIEAGKIDVFPEYTGNLLQYYKPETKATESQDVYDELVGSLPEGLRVLEQADATDADSYVVTGEFAMKHSLKSIGDLAGVNDLVLAGNSELETRPYGPEGLKSVYGVTVAQFKPVEDSGGPLTIKALRDGDADVADLYSSTPDLASGDLVVLDDPKGLFLASHLVPVVSANVNDDAAAVINSVSEALSAEELIAMNAESVNDQRAAANIAADFLKRNGIVS
ncbi:MAG: ABC transporter substrate-binding protein [Atopobiaceae bacterium]|nr:ABC transporter substrate-binding protein [Atopobiaceae bacterium]